MHIVETVRQMLTKKAPEIEEEQDGAVHDGPYG